MADDPRDALLSVARELIEKRGYLGLSMRTAAAAAGVTPEVARRYFRNRDALFAAALRLPLDPTTAIPTLVAPGLEGMGERLVRFTLDILKDPEARAELVSLARTGVNAGHAAAGLQDFLEKGVVDRVASMIGVPDARMRSALITSYLLGIAMTRYGVRLEPLSSASEEDVIRMVAPVIQDLLDPRKPLPGSNRNRARAGESQSAPGAPRPAGSPVPPRPPRTFQADPAAAHHPTPASTDSGRPPAAAGTTRASRPTGAVSKPARTSARGGTAAKSAKPPASAPKAASKSSSPPAARPTSAPTKAPSTSGIKATAKSAPTKSAPIKAPSTTGTKATAKATPTDAAAPATPAQAAPRASREAPSPSTAAPPAEAPTGHASPGTRASTPDSGTGPPAP